MTLGQRVASIRPIKWIAIVIFLASMSATFYYAGMTLSGLMSNVHQYDTKEEYVGRYLDMDFISYQQWEAIDKLLLGNPTALNEALPEYMGYEVYRIEGTEDELLYSNMQNLQGLENTYEQYNYFQYDATKEHWTDKFLFFAEERVVIRYHEDGRYESNATHYIKQYMTTDIASNTKVYNQIKLMEEVYDAKIDAIPLTICFTIFSIFLLTFLSVSAGRRKQDDIIYTNFLTRIPFDVLTVIVTGIGFAGLICMALVIEYTFAMYTNFWVGTYEDVKEMGLALGLPLYMGVLLAYYMTFCIHIKNHTLVSGSLLGKCWLFLWRQIKKPFQVTKLFFYRLSVMWKALLGLILFSILSFIGILFGGMEAEYLIFWAIQTAFIWVLVMAVSLMLYRLQEAGEALAKGDLEYQVDTKKLYGAFVRFGDLMNEIAEGMNEAVEERMKSERMKTELITNVSHDIKTPLTSIINYSDLIAKEKTDNPKIEEYVEVLYRQSRKLKKLIDDLLEVSKANSGTMEIQLEPCHIDVLFTQMIGEYAERLEELNLTLMMKKPDESVVIMGDSRRLWRVVDNLMNNICNYAQPYTRVYVSLEEYNGTVLIAFKNTSKYELDMDAEELMERFVRGDSSRHTDGNGLGLSIAQSLVELQGGDLRIVIDGDLFKVVLEFKKITNPDEPQEATEQEAYYEEASTQVEIMDIKVAKEHKEQEIILEKEGISEKEVVYMEEIREEIQAPKIVVRGMELDLYEPKHNLNETIMSAKADVIDLEDEAFRDRKE